MKLTHFSPTYGCKQENRASYYQNKRILLFLCLNSSKGNCQRRFCMNVDVCGCFQKTNFAKSPVETEHFYKTLVRRGSPGGARSCSAAVLHGFDKVCCSNMVLNATTTLFLADTAARGKLALSTMAFHKLSYARLTL